MLKYINLYTDKNTATMEPLPSDSFQRYLRQLAEETLESYTNLCKTVNSIVVTMSKLDPDYDTVKDLNYNMWSHRENYWFIFVYNIKKFGYHIYTSNMYDVHNEIVERLKCKLFKDNEDALLYIETADRLFTHIYSIEAKDSPYFRVVRESVRNRSSIGNDGSKLIKNLLNK